MSILTIIGAADLAALRPPARSIVNTVTVDGVVADFTHIPGGPVTVTSPEVLPSSIITIAYSIAESDSEVKVGIPTTEAGRVPVDTSLMAGEISQIGRLAGGAIVEWEEVTASRIVHSGPSAAFYGIRVVVAGTSVTAYDSTSASGTKFIDAEATTAKGTLITPMGQGVGVLLKNGLYVSITGGTVLVGIARG